MKEAEDLLKLIEDVDRSEDKAVQNILHAIVSINGSISNLIRCNAELENTNHAGFKAIVHVIDGLHREIKFLETLISIFNGEV